MQTTEAEYKNVMADSESKITRVAVGVIKNEQGEVLLAKRAQHLHQGGLWEFPGGKIEKNESVRDALQRELDEELGIRVHNASPLIKIPYDYADKSVLLDVWVVEKFTGTPTGLQGQPLEWVDIAHLNDYALPQANKSILTALKLPREMMVTGHWHDAEDFALKMRRALQKGVRLVQLRAHQCTEQEYLTILTLAIKICDEFGALLAANTRVDLFEKLHADGLHLTSLQLMQCTERPVKRSVILGASCHSWIELQQAMRIGADYITLGAVFTTSTHPDIQPMGIEQFSILSKQFPGLVYALGGMKTNMLAKMVDANAYGIAGIGCYWN